MNAELGFRLHFEEQLRAMEADIELGEKIHLTK